MNIDLITLFPEFFAGPLETGLIGKAIAAGRADVRTIDPRAYTQDRHRTVDDTPYGGGGGMVLKPEPIAAAIQQARGRGPGPVVLLSPQGRPLAQSDFKRWATQSHLTLLSGRYEGFDERIRALVDDEVSLGDFVLTGGEYGALAIVDGVIRLLPGTLGNQDCPEQDSFEDGLLEYPHFTRPATFEGQSVPDVLQSGHHQRCAAWRQAQSLLRTRRRRPDLLKRRGLTPAEATILGEDVSAPTLVALPAARVDPHILAVAAAYAVDRVFAVAPDADASTAVDALLGAAVVRYPIREALRSRKNRRLPAAEAQVDLGARLTVLDDWAALPTRWGDREIRRLGASRRPPLDADFDATGAYVPRVSGSPVPCVVFGGPTEVVDRYLPVIRGAETGNRLPLAAVLGIYLDRIVGEG